MFFAIRMLTLVAFTAHAVLGCCLSHGNCMQNQAVLLTVQCCDHDDYAGDTHNDHDESGVSHIELEQHSSFDLLSVCPSCPFEGHGHSNHCDDSECVFGLSGNNDSSIVWPFLVVSSCINTTINFWHGASPHAKFLRAWLDGPPSIHVERSVLQVWLI